MAEHKYIEVAAPDRGLANHLPPTDISPRHCSECAGIYFWNGTIRKMFRESVTEFIKVDDTETELTTLDEIIAIVQHDHNFAETTPERHLYAFTINDAFRFDEDNSWWELANEVLFSELCEAVGTWVAYNGPSSIVQDTGTSDALLVGFRQTNTAAVVYEVRVPDVPAANYNWQKDGAGWSGNIGITDNVPQEITNGVDDKSFYIMFDGSQVQNDQWTITHGYGANAVTRVSTPTAKQGTYSIKIAVGAAFTTGVVAAFDQAATLYRAITPGAHVHLRMWIRSDVALDNGDLRILLLARDADANGDEGIFQGVTIDRHDAYEVGALIVDTWTRLDIEIADTVQNVEFMNAVKYGVAFDMVVDKGAVNIYVDDIYFMDVLEISTDGLRDEAMMTCSLVGNIEGTLLNRLFFTQFKYHAAMHVHWFNRTGGWHPLDHGDLVDGGYNTSSGGDSDQRKNHQCRALSGFKGHLTFIGTREGVADGGSSYDETEYLNRLRWSNLAVFKEGGVNGLDSWDIPTAGTLEKSDVPGELQAAVILGDNEYIFTTDAIIRRTFLGGETAIWQTNTIYDHDGLLAPRLLVKVGTDAYFVGKFNVYRLSASGTVTPIGDPIRSHLYHKTDGIAKSTLRTLRKSFIFAIPDFDLLVIHIPGLDVRFGQFGYNYREGTWTQDLFSDPPSAAAPYSHLATNTTQGDYSHGVAVGIGTKFYDLDYDNPKTYGYWDSKDFSFPGNGRPPEFTQWKGVSVRGRGDNILVWYSINSGGTGGGSEGPWTEAGTITFDSTTIWGIKKLNFNVGSQLLRVRFYNRTAGETFEINKFWIEYEEGGAN